MIHGPSHGEGVIGGVQQQRDLLGRQRRHLCPGHRGWRGVGGDIAGEQPPGDRLGQGAVQAAVHGQDVLRGQAARLAVPASADGQPVIDGLDLQRGELLERPGTDVGSHMVAEQRGVSGHGPGAEAAANTTGQLGLGSAAVGGRIFVVGALLI
jgi:hypothetical protein